MAGSDSFRITVKGKGSHGDRPWAGVDPIVIAAQIILGLQTIQSRQVDVTSEPSVLTIGMIQAGTRHSIIPDRAELRLNIRTYDTELRKHVYHQVQRAKRGEADAPAPVR